MSKIFKYYIKTMKRKNMKYEIQNTKNRRNTQNTASLAAIATISAHETTPGH